MKKKITKIMGVVLALVLISSMMAFAIPTSADPYKPLNPVSNKWTSFTTTEGFMGSYFYDGSIDQVGPIASAINGDLYAYVHNNDPVAALNEQEDDLFKSTDAGRSWSFSTDPHRYAGVAIIEIVCSELSEDVVYVTDGNYVYKSVDAGMNFTIVAEDSLETILLGTCGPSTTITTTPITCMDVAYDSSGDAYIFIGVEDTDSAHGPSVLYLFEGGYPAAWTDLELHCFHNDAAHAQDDGGYMPYSIGCAPDFATTKKIYVAVSNGEDISAHPDVANDEHTYVISSVGVICSWTEVSELLYNCIAGNDFEIRHASRFAFPDDFDSTKTMFLGVAGTRTASVATYTYDEGGDVYRIVDDMNPTTLALDLNVNPGTGGCSGYHSNICSLSMVGSTANGTLMAGALDVYQLQAPVEVYYSTGGWSWSHSAKDPTGGDADTEEGWTYVLLYEGSLEGFAATSGCDCAFSMSCGDVVGAYWNQISLIDMEIDGVLDMDFGPTHATGNQAVFVLTGDEVGCEDESIHSLLRFDGTFWERVFSTRYYSVTSSVSLCYTPGGVSGSSAANYCWVEVSPDFDDTGCVFLSNNYLRMARSLDEGCSWTELSYPCTDVDISAWIVVDESTVLTSGCDTYAGTIFRTTTAGAEPWSEFTIKNCKGELASCGVDFDLSPNVSVDENVLFGDLDGQVYLSQDLGETWGEIKDAITATSFNEDDSSPNTYVVFDPGYATADDPGENTVYAAAGTKVGRCTVDVETSLCAQDWLYLSNSPQADCDTFNLCCASGIDIDGDPTLYVADCGSDEATGPVVDGTIEIDCCEATDNDCSCSADWTLTDITLITISGTFEDDELLEIIEYDAYCEREWSDYYSMCVCSLTVDSIAVRGYESGAIGYISFTGTRYLDDCLEPGGGYDPECTNCYSNAVIIASFLRVDTSGATSACYNGVWRTVNPLASISETAPWNYVEWEFLTLGLNSNSILRHPEADSYGVYPDDLWLTHASSVIWALDATNLTYIWAWDDPLATPVVQLSPADGANLEASTFVTLEWETLDSASMYEVKVYEECPECLNPDEMKELTDSPYYAIHETCIKITGLTAGTTYYWKVRVACDSPQVSKWSDLRSFTTALESTSFLCSPECGSSGIVLTTNFSWYEVDFATSYELQVVAASADGTADFTGATTYTSDVNAFASIPGLEYSTVYYWRVRAIKDGIAGDWATCLFTTMDEPEECPDAITPVTIVTEEVTPVWIWVIIGIGGALTIVVIILIVTTRKVP